MDRLARSCVGVTMPRSVIAALALLVAGCAPMPEPLEPTPRSESPLESSLESQSIPFEGSFAGVDGWRGIGLGMPADEVQQILVDSGLSFRRSTIRRYPRSGPRGHTNEPVFHVEQEHGRWMIRCGNAGTVRSIRFDARELESLAVAQVLRDFESRYGAPTQASQGSVLRWSNETLQMRLELSRFEGRTSITARLDHAPRS